MFHWVYMFLLAYVVLAVITAIVLGVQASITFALWDRKAFQNIKTTAVGFGFAGLIGIVGGVLFPRVWYKRLRK